MSHKSPKDYKSITDWIKQYIVTIEPIPPKEQLLSPTYETISNTHDSLKYVIKNTNNVQVNVLSNGAQIGTIESNSELEIDYTWGDGEVSINKGYKFTNEDYEDSDVTYFMVTRPKEQLLSPTYETISNTYDMLKYVIKNTNDVQVNVITEGEQVGSIDAGGQLEIDYTWLTDQVSINMGYKFTNDNYDDSDTTYFMVIRPEKPKYTISITQPEHGTITCDKTTASYEEQVIATVTPDDGYELNKFYVNNVESETTFSMPNNDVTLSATLEWIIYGTLEQPTCEIISNTTTELVYSIKNSNNVDVLFNGETISASGALELTHVWESGETSFLIDGYFSAEHYINSSELVETVDKPSEPQPSVSIGDLITMNLGNATPAAGTNNLYRVLKVDNNIVEVVAMYDISNSQQFNPSGSGQAYNGSSLDTALNTTFYNSLNSTAKSAIVANNITQYKYSWDPVSDDHRSLADYSSKAVYASGLSRYIYALDVEDIEMYFGGTGGSASAKTRGTFTKAQLWQLFWNTTSKPSNYTYPWLRSADSSDSNYCWFVDGGNGYVNSDSYYSYDAAKPAFKIDLSKIEWSKDE